MESPPGSPQQHGGSSPSTSPTSSLEHSPTNPLQHNPTSPTSPLEHSPTNPLQHSPTSPLQHSLISPSNPLEHSPTSPSSSLEHSPTNPLQHNPSNPTSPQEAWELLQSDVQRVAAQTSQDAAGTNESCSQSPSRATEEAAAAGDEQGDTAFSSQFVLDDWEGPPVAVQVASGVAEPSEQAGVLVAIHGNGRNAQTNHSVWKNLIRGRDVLVLTPCFSREHFASSRQFHYGGVQEEDGSWNDPHRWWSFQAVRLSVERVRRELKLQTREFSLYGHAAGAQFVLHYLLWCGHQNVRAAVAANADHYTMPSLAIGYPWGMGGSPLGPQQLKRMLSAPLILMLGALDTDPAHDKLTHHRGAEEQGPHRLGRGCAFAAIADATCASLGTRCSFHTVVVPWAGHSPGRMAAAAMQQLFPTNSSGGGIAVSVVH